MLAHKALYSEDMFSLISLALFSEIEFIIYLTTRNAPIMFPDVAWSCLAGPLFIRLGNLKS